MADKLRALKLGGNKEVEAAVRETTLLAHEEIVDKITNDIEPHSGMSRKNNPQESVTDLVDTGFYRASWNTSFPNPLKGVLATNCEYAEVLENGTEDGSHQAFYPARDTARKMKAVFKKRLKKAIQDTLR